MRLFIIEDDVDLGDALCRRLKHDGHAVDWVQDGEAANDILCYQKYDAIILDIEIPSMDGIGVLRALRRRGDVTPVLMLTARSRMDDRVDALDIGADDYLSKPFDVREFDARCRALLRRTTGNASSSIKVGKIHFDGIAKLVRIDDVQITLPNREFRLLEILLGNIGRVASKEQIAEQLFDFDDEAGPNAIEVYVGRLRRKLGDALTIQTVRGMGYLTEVPKNQ
jgi:two-component system, OmpR family, response regulator TctD